MSLRATTTPARLAAPATVKLPRIALLGLALTYILFGLFMRDPWKTDDAVGLATMLTALREGGNAWLLPHLGQLAYVQNGPLITWIGAAAMALFGPWIGDITAGRLPNFLWFGITATSLWYGTYLLGRRPEAQPLSLPFGGEPTVNDYGRMLADAALLLLLATVGILQRLHETSEIPAIMAAQAFAFYALARMLDKPVEGVISLGFALGAAFLTRGWVGTLPIMLGGLLAFHPKSALWPQRYWLPLALLLAGALVLCWWIPASHASPYWVRNWKFWNLNNYTWPALSKLLLALRDLPWYLWPTWPLALLALWRWRAWRYAPHVWLPLALLICPLILIAFTDEPSDAEFSLLALPCACLAAFSLPTLRRAVINTLDWFAVMCFSLTVATVWLGWLALNFGYPTKIAHNIKRQLTGYLPELSWLALVLALGVTIGWIVLVFWRLRVRPKALWRGTIMSAAGLTVTWVLLVLLWQPPVNYARSYRQVSNELAYAIAHLRKPSAPHDHPNPPYSFSSKECVRSVGLGSGQRAAFLIYNDLNFPYDSQCHFILQQTTRSSLRDGTAAYSQGAEVLWQGGRRADRNEVFRLLRVPPLLP